MLAQQITDLKDHKQLRSLPKFPANASSLPEVVPKGSTQSKGDRRKPRSLKPGPALPPPGVQTQKNPVPNHPVGQGRGGNPPERLFLPGHWLLGDFRPRASFVRPGGGSLPEWKRPPPPGSERALPLSHHYATNRPLLWLWRVCKSVSSDCRFIVIRRSSRAVAAANARWI
jgi:hypothetical protein